MQRAVGLAVSWACLVSTFAPAFTPVLAAQTEETPEVAAAAPGLTPHLARYRDLAGVTALGDAWLAERPENVRVLTFGAAEGSAPIPALEVYGPGPLAPDERPAILLLGGLDGTSLVGGECVLAIVADLLLEPRALPSDVTFLAVPWANPEALAETSAGRARDGRGLEPVDEDRDGLVDEDGADDLDGDGLLLEMLVPDPQGGWTRGEDGLRLVRAGPGDSPRYERTLEGADDDGDGRFNEDGPGGIVIDRSFPVGRAAGSSDPLVGALPMSTPLARAVADLALRRRVAVALVYGGNHGRIAMPGGALPQPQAAVFPNLEDLPAFERATALFYAQTERPAVGLQTLREARQSERSGAAIDWLYAVPGALALEVSSWGPDVAFEPAAPGSLTGGERPTDLEHAWIYWIDNERGGLGFSPWRPVDLGDGRTGLVGGFEGRTWLNPPEELLPRALSGQASFVRELAASLPRLELSVLEPTRTGDLLRFRVRVENAGRLPTGLWPTGRWHDLSESAGVEVRLELPADGRLVAGPRRAWLGRLAGGSAARDLEWLVLAVPGSKVVVEAVGPWCAPVRREVKR